MQVLFESLFPVDKDAMTDGDLTAEKLASHIELTMSQYRILLP